MGQEPVSCEAGSACPGSCLQGTSPVPLAVGPARQAPRAGSPTAQEPDPVRLTTPSVPLSYQRPTPR